MTDPDEIRTSASIGKPLAQLPGVIHWVNWVLFLGNVLIVYALVSHRKRG